VKRSAEEDEEEISVEKRVATLEKYLERVNTISISLLNADNIIDEGFSVKGYVVSSSTEVLVDVPALFEWTEAKECSQHGKYIPHIAVLLKNDQFLSVKVPPNNQMLDNKRLPIHLKGTTDAMICPSGAPSELIAVWELKKAVGERNFPQWHGQVISANSKYGHLKPFGVLTDLRNSWAVCWIDGDTIYQVTFERTSVGKLIPLTRKTAIHFLRKCSLASVVEVGERVFGDSLKAILEQDIKVVLAFAERKTAVVNVQEDAPFVSLREFREEEEFKKSKTLDLLNLKDSFDSLPSHLYSMCANDWCK